jgi:hypothetical protein
LYDPWANARNLRDVTTGARGVVWAVWLAEMRRSSG